MKAQSIISSWLLIACFLFAFLQITKAQDIELLGTYDIHDVTAIDVNNDIAFLATNYCYMIILDIADKNNPTLITEIYTVPYQHSDIVVQDNYLYLNASHIFVVFDISDVANPFIVGSCATQPSAGMAIQGNYAYTTHYQYGVKIIDISDPSNPAVIGQDSSWSMDISAAGDYAYLAAYGNIHVLDISDPTNPLVIGSALSYGNAVSIVVQNSIAYVAVRDPGLTIVDVSVPTNPAVLSVTPPMDRAEAIDVIHDYAFISDDGAGISIYNISDPANPVYDTSFNPGTNEMVTVLQEGYYTYFITQSYGIFGIFRYTGLGNGALTGIVSNNNGDPLEGTIVTAINTPFADTTDANGEYFMEGFYTDLHDVEFAHPYYVDTLIADLSLVTGDTVVLDVILEYPPGIDVGVSSIISPVDSVEFGEEHDLVVEVTNHGLSAQTFDVYFEIYYADSNELLLADTATVSDMPEMFVETVYFLETFMPERFKSYDVISYTALSGDENIENDTSVAICHGYKSYPQIEEISYTWFPYGLNFIYIKGNYAYITTQTSGETIIVDITNRESPVVVGSIETHSWALAGSGNYLYFKSGVEPLIYIYDISNPVNPAFVNSCSTSYPGAEYMAINGDYLYTCHPGVDIFDISNPVEPAFISNLNTSGWAINITIDSGSAYISNYYNGLIADISNPASPFITGTITNNSEVTDMCVSGNYAYVTDNPYGFQVYDVSDPYNPTLFDEYTGLEGTWFIEIQNELIYTDNYQEFIIYEIYEPGLLIPAAFLTTSSPSGWYFTVAGDYIYLPCGQNLKILRFPVSGSGACYYTTGDVNNSGIYNGLDVTFAVAFFKGGPPPPYECECTPGNIWYVGGDVNGSCSFNGLDVTYGVTYFKGGSAPFPCADCPPAE